MAVYHYCLSFLVFLIVCVLGAQAQEVTARPDGLIPGPRGTLLHPDCHVELPQGARLQDNDHILHADGTLEEIRPCNASTGANSNSKREGNGWNTYARYFINALLDEFDGDWIVPNYPAAGYQGQLIYLFTGLEYDGSAILQPVIWYGYSPAGGGAGWFAAVWYVQSNNNFVTSNVAQVYPGQDIHATMARAPGTGWAGNMYANGGLVSSGWFTDALYSNAFVSLEVYNVLSCQSFPYYQGTSFQNMAIRQDGVGWVGFNSANWAVTITQTDCGQNMVCGGNVCTMVYGAWYPCPDHISPPYVPTNTILFSRGENTAVSPDCRVRLIMQDDGNLVLYNQYYQSIWNSGTAGVGTAPFSMIVQGDGNVVIYDVNGWASWNTGSTGRGQSPWVFVPQPDGNLVLYDANGVATWYTATHG